MHQELGPRMFFQQAKQPPTEGEKNTKDAETNLQNELVDLLSIDVVEQYHNKKLLSDKYCDKMLKRIKILKIINCSSASALQVLRRLGSIFTSVNAAVQKLKKDSGKSFGSSWLTIPS
ncbi:hypothetical protein Tco_1412566 [Tanacetum coccineum]